MHSTEDQIRALAYQLWQQDGCPDGRPMDHWLQAEAMLRTVPLTASPAPVLTPALEAEPVRPEGKSKNSRKPRTKAEPAPDAKPKAARKSRKTPGA